MQITAVPTPRFTWVPGDTIVFNEAVTGFNVSDLSLTLNGGSNLLTASQTLTSSDNTTFTLGNLAALTTAVGTYSLTQTPPAAASWATARPLLVPPSPGPPPPRRCPAQIATVTTPRTTPVASDTITFNEAVTGFDLSDLKLTVNGVLLPTAAQTLNTTDNTTFTLTNLTSITTAPGMNRLSLSATNSGITAGGKAMVNNVSVFWTNSTPVVTKPKAAVVGTHLFYNDSKFDGFSTAANAADDTAIATDKTALLPGKKATYANISNYSNGINGIMVDVANLAGKTLTAADFTFKTGNNNSTNTWPTGPNPSSIVIRPGAGVSGSARVELIWPNHSTSASSAIAGKWLQVTVKADANTGLSAANVFYFGNAIGDTGNSATDAAVTVADVNAIKAHESAAAVAITNVFDNNRSGVINSADATDASSHETSGATALQLITP